MTNIRELFEAHGEPIEAKDIREGDQIASLWDYDKGYVVSIAESDKVQINRGQSYRLLHRPAPVLPTTPGSILADKERTARAVLTPDRGWYNVVTEAYLSVEKVQHRLTDGIYTILLDTGAAK